MIRRTAGFIAAYPACRAPAIGGAEAVRAFLDNVGDGVLARASRDAAGLDRTAALVAAGLADERQSLDAIRAQFDALWVAPEASVALYSLGSPEILERATSEIVTRLKNGACWGRSCRCSTSAAASAGSSVRCRPHSQHHRHRCLARHDRRGAPPLPRSSECRVSRLLGPRSRRFRRPASTWCWRSTLSRICSRPIWRSRRGTWHDAARILSAGRGSGDLQFLLSRRCRRRPARLGPIGAAHGLAMRARRHARLRPMGRATFLLRSPLAPRSPRMKASVRASAS